jgi:hypothetical protein
MLAAALMYQGDDMQTRIEMKKGNDVVLQIICKSDLSDGDLAIMLEDVGQDLRWNVMRDTETHRIRAEG